MIHAVLFLIIFSNGEIPPGGETLTVEKREINLTAPTFITPDHLWINENNRLEILLPNPNADGIDPTGAENIRYNIRIMIGCSEFYSTVIESSVYPRVFRLAFEVPFGDYEVNISRLTSFFKRDESEGTVLVGPSGTSAAAISSDFLEIDRWLLHVPKVAGGFIGRVTFNNRFPQLPATIWVAGFDSQGQLVSGTQKEVVVIGQNPVADIYGNDTALFTNAQQDQISHIGLYEPNDNRYIETSITYRSIQEGALEASASEVSFFGGSAVGRSFSMEARKSETFWDGVAVLNLAGLMPTEVSVVLRKIDDGSEIASTSLGTIDAGGKGLFVISDFFDFDPNAYYTIESDQTNRTFQVLGLRGNVGRPDRDSKRASFHRHHHPGLFIPQHRNGAEPLVPALCGHPVRPGV